MKTSPHTQPNHPQRMQSSPSTRRLGRIRSWLAPQASPFPSRLANVAGRISFTFVWVCGSASGCSPPRLTATQLPSAALPLLVSGGLRLSLVVLMVTSFALGTSGPLVRSPHDHRSLLDSLKSQTQVSALSVVPPRPPRLRESNSSLFSPLHAPRSLLPAA